MTTMIVKDELYASLENNDIVDDLFVSVNSLDDNDIVLDFSGVKWISRSFAQAYFVNKKKSVKNIVEINLSGDNLMVMEVVGKQIMPSSD